MALAAWHSPQPPQLHTRKRLSRHAAACARAAALGREQNAEGRQLQVCSRVVQFFRWAHAV